MRINSIQESEAVGQLSELYSSIAGARGGVSDVLKLHSLLPETLKDHFELYKTLMFGLRETKISRKQLELIAVTVSACNKCTYCIAHHSVPLKQILKNDELLKAIQVVDLTVLKSELDPLDYYFVLFAEKLTLKPYEVSDDDIGKLRGSGCSDEQILHVTLVINYFNFVNRNVLALGVELEPDHETKCR